MRRRRGYTRGVNRLIAATVCAVSVAACATVHRPPAAEPAPVDVSAEIARLDLPPDEASEDATGRLQRASKQGNAAARWALVHYLVDVFDHARFTGDASSRRLLFDALDVAPGQGAQTTDAVLDALLVRVDALAVDGRLPRVAQQTRSLLELDRVPATSRDDVFGRMAILKDIARSDSPVAPSARLRLFEFCQQAFRDAALAPRAARHHRLTYCLYPLWDSDPAPYFTPELVMRPPPPDWRVMAERLLGLLTSTAEADGRLAELADILVRQETRFFQEVEEVFPVLPEPGELPVVNQADAYTWAPVLPVSRAVDARELVAGPLASDGRAVVTLVAARETPATALAQAARALIALNVQTVELAVAFAQKLVVPTGDYWNPPPEPLATNAEGDMLRTGVLSFSLALEDASLTPASRRTPRSGQPAGQKIFVTIAPDRWQVGSSTGSLPPVKTLPLVGEQLALVKRAFPRQATVVLVPLDGSTVGDLARTAEAAGVFTTLALGDRAPAARGRRFAVQVKRLAGAEVAIAPEEATEETGAVRACYVDALENAPRLRGTIVIERDAAGEAAVTQGPADETLRACVLGRLGERVASGELKSVRIELTP